MKTVLLLVGDEGTDDYLVIKSHIIAAKWIFQMFPERSGKFKKMN